MKSLNVKMLKNVVGKNGPTILTVLSVGGLIMTTIMAVRVTPKVLDIIKEEQWRLEREEEDIFLTKWEKFKLAWPCYIPTAVMGLATIASIIGSNTLNLKRNAALTSAYFLSETALKEYQAKIIQTIGANKAKLIKDEIAQDHVNRTNKDNKTVIITGNGDTLCLDLTTGRYFRSSVDKIKRAEIDINNQLLDDTTMSLNEIYDCLDLEHVSAGGQIGWDRNKDGKLEFDISTCMSQDDEPCITIQFNAKPNFR